MLNKRIEDFNYDRWYIVVNFFLSNLILNSEN